jgi:hypothetical protein
MVCGFRGLMIIGVVHRGPCDLLGW